MMSGNQDQYGGISKGRQGTDKRQARQTMAEEEECFQDSLEEEDKDGQESATEDEQESFEQDNLNDLQQRFLSKVRVGPKSSRKPSGSRQITALRTINLSGSGVARAMNLSSDATGSLYMDSCADTSVLNIGKGGHFVEVARTMRSVTLIGFHNDLKKRLLPLDLGSLL